MPILGIIASQGRVVSNSYESIATVTVGSGGTANVEFTSIPATYTHLQVRGIGRGSFTDLTMRFNSDTGNNYSSHRLYGTGSSVGTDGEDSSGAYGTYILYAARLSSAASVFCANIIDIFDYANTDKYTTSRSLYGFDENGSGNIFLASGNWRNTNAITTIRLTPNSGTIAQYSQFALYGIKGS
jgi:hypothetical protein